jgi:hypothetical protein
MYLLVITLGLGLSYLCLKFVFSWFFLQTDKVSNQRKIFSFGLICFFSLLVYFLVSQIPSVELANRLLHGLGGGFLAFFVCYLVVRDNHFIINKIQFFILSALLVTALGVANEIIEFIMQNYWQFTMAPSINDTWLDLISNSVGLLMAGAIFVPCIDRQK